LARANIKGRWNTVIFTTSIASARLLVPLGFCLRVAKWWCRARLNTVVRACTRTWVVAGVVCSRVQHVWRTASVKWAFVALARIVRVNSEVFTVFVDTLLARLFFGTLLTCLDAGVFIIDETRSGAIRFHARRTAKAAVIGFACFKFVWIATIFAFRARWARLARHVKLTVRHSIRIIQARARLTWSTF